MYVANFGMHIPNFGMYVPNFGIENSSRTNNFLPVAKIKQKPQKPSGAVCSLALRLKARFHASPDAIMALHAKHRQHQSKNPGFQPKKSLRDINVQKF